MVLGERAKADSVLLLSVGLATGFILACVVFFTLFNHTAVGSSLRQTASNQIVANASGKTATAKVVQTSIQTASSAIAASSTITTPIPFAASSAPVAQPDFSSSQAPSPFSYFVPQQATPAVAAEPDAQFHPVNVSVSTSGSGTELTTIDSDSPANPNWAMDRNGLVGNPCVDPPSTKGRAYTSAAN